MPNNLSRQMLRQQWQHIMLRRFLIQLSILAAIWIHGALAYSLDVPMAQSTQLPHVITQLFDLHSPSSPPFQCVPLVKQRVKKLEFAKVSVQPNATAKRELTKVEPLEVFEQGYGYVGAGFGSYIYQLRQALSHRDYSQLAQMMHPRLKASKRSIAQALGALSVEPAAAVSIHQMWAVYSHNYSSTDISCDADISLSPLYGYQLQFFVWFSLAGEQNIGRLMMIVVPADDQLHIGLLRSHMWTHDSKPPTEWLAEADKELAQNYVLSAYVKYKVALMLLDGGTYYQLALATKIKEFLTQRQATTAWHNVVNQHVAPQAAERLVEAVPLLTKGGAGMYLKFGLTQEWSSKQIRAHCRALLAKFESSAAMKNLTGIRCGYYLPLETDYTKNSVLGSLYLAKSNSTSTP